MKLSPTQHDLLVIAADRGDGLIVGPMTTSVRKALIARGLASSDEEGIRITDMARAALPSLAAPPTTPPTAAVCGGPAGKLAIIVDLLSRPNGASLTDLQDATAWQAHSVRSALSAALKKRLGLTVVSQKTGTGRIYRIVSPAGAASFLSGGLQR